MENSLTSKPVTARTDEQTGNPSNYAMKSTLYQPQATSGTQMASLVTSVAIGKKEYNAGADSLKNLLGQDNITKAEKVHNESRAMLT